MGIIFLIIYYTILFGAAFTLIYLDFFKDD